VVTAQVGSIEISLAGETLVAEVREGDIKRTYRGARRFWHSARPAGSHPRRLADRERCNLAGHL